MIRFAPLRFVVVLALLAGGIATVAPQASASTLAIPPDTLLESFDSGGPTWRTSYGSATPATTTGTQGTGALAIAYNVTNGLAEVERVTTPPELPSIALPELTLDVRGNGTWNGLYLRLRDATGEVFMYSVSALNHQGWQAKTIDLTQPPASRSQGNNDGVLDAPVSLLTFLVAPNSSQPAIGTVAVDNLRTTGAAWTLPAAGVRRFAPSAGQGTALAFTAGAPGDYRLELADSAGRTKTISGTALVAGPVSLWWFGRADDYTFTRGNIRAVLRYDTSPDGSLSAVRTTATVPYFTGAALRIENGAGSIVGVNSFLSTASTYQDGDRQAELMEDAFVRQTRTPFLWMGVEPRKGYYDWARFDRAVNTLSARNIDVIGGLLYSAPWASSAPAGTPVADLQYYPPKSMADYAAYAAAVVHRYKDRVHVWEVWNEPNDDLYWKSGEDPVAYAAMLKAAYVAIKAEDPTATVISGGLGGFELSFMEGLRSQGALNSMDGFGLHTYVAGAPEKGLAAVWIDNAAAYLQRYVGGKPIWITEMGWSTCSTCVTEAQQAEYLPRAYLEAAAKGVRSISAYSLVEDVGTGAWQDHLGLTEPGGRLKPAYNALRDVGAALNQMGSAGEMAPTVDGISTAVSDLASTTGLAVVPQGGGSANLTTTASRHGGAGGLQLAYAMTGASRGFNVTANIPLPGTPTAISMWAYGDNSGSPLYMQFTDASGESYAGVVGQAGIRRWTRLTLFTDGSNLNWNYSGGDNNGVINYPIAFRSLTVLKGPLGQLAGTVFIDDLAAHYGTNVHGAVLQGKGVISQSVYHLGAAQTGYLPVTDLVAQRLLGKDLLPVVVTAGLATTTLSRTPFYLLSAMAVTQTGIAGAAVTTVTWQNGDPAFQSVSVLNSSGTVLRVIAAHRRYDSGLQAATWDGRDAGGALVLPGTYRVQLLLAGVDGRTTTIERTLLRL